MKQRVAIVTVEVLLEPGYPGLDLTDVIKHVGDGLANFKHYRDAESPMRYANHKVIDARLVREK